MNRRYGFSAALTLCCYGCVLFSTAWAQSPAPSPSSHAVVLHATRRLDIESGKINPAKARAKTNVALVTLNSSGANVFDAVV